MSIPASTLGATVDNVDGSSKVAQNVNLRVFDVWLEEARDNVMHTWLWVLRSHVEPHGSAEGLVAVLKDFIWVFKIVHLGIIGLIPESGRESAVVVSIRQLEWSSWEVLLAILIWPGFVDPARAMIVAVSTEWEIITTSNQFSVVESLSPEVDSIGRLFPGGVIASLLDEMREHRGKLFLAHLFVSVIRTVVLITEGWELGYCLQESLVREDIVFEFEEVVKGGLIHDDLDSLDIVLRVVIGDIALECLWRVEYSLCGGIVGIWDAVLDTDLHVSIVPVLTCPEAGCLNSCLGVAEDGSESNCS